MRVTGVDACRHGWVAVSLEAAAPEGAAGGCSSGSGSGSGGRWRVAVRLGASLAELLDGAGIVGIDMPLGLLESGWREADRLARGLLGPRRSSVFAIPPLAVWAEDDYPAANRRCRELAGKGLSAQAWGLRRKLLEANAYRETCGHPLYEVHPELAFGAIAGQPLALSKHTAAGLDLRRKLLAGVGIEVPARTALPASAGRAGRAGRAMAADILDAAAVAWSAWRIATGQAVTIPDRPQQDTSDREIAIRY